MSFTMFICYVADFHAAGDEAGEGGHLAASPRQAQI
jgi:hypothetical protein